jgi:hypothetical protein
MMSALVPVQFRHSSHTTVRWSARRFFVPRGTARAHRRSDPDYCREILLSPVIGRGSGVNSRLVGLPDMCPVPMKRTQKVRTRPAACKSRKAKAKEWWRRGESQVLGDLSRAESRGTPVREALPPEDNMPIPFHCFRRRRHLITLSLICPRGQNSLLAEKGPDGQKKGDYHESENR